jgi:hypothetical protein
VLFLRFRAPNPAGPTLFQVGPVFLLRSGGGPLIIAGKLAAISRG